MPVEAVNSNLIRARDVDAITPDPVLLSGITRITTGEVDNAADASSGSAYHLCDLPSACLLDPSSFVVVDGWGFASIRLGTAGTVDALISVLKSAGPVATPVAAGDAKYDKRLWEILGFAEDPGGMIGIYAHAIAAATAAGKLRFRFATILN